MKRILALLLLTALLLGLDGCSYMVRQDYLAVKRHVEQSLPETEPTEAEEPTLVTNRNELRGAILSFVRNWTERGSIRVQDYAGDISTDLTEAMTYATKEDPIGAYAVDYADAELRGGASSGVVEVSIVFRRSAAEIDSIVTVSGLTGAYNKIRQALADYDTALTLRIRNYEETDFAAYVRNYCLDHLESVVALPELSAAVYPEEGNTRILELHFTYPASRDELRSMQASVETILDSAAAYVSGGVDQQRRVQLLGRFLLTRFSYTVAQEEPQMPAYDLLYLGIAHSLSFAEVFQYECSRADIDSWLVSGTRNGEPYYWNIVHIQEIYYHVDLMRSVERGEDALTLLSAETLETEGYAWDVEAYPANPLQEPEPTE